MAAFDASGKGVLADAIALTGAADRVITLSDPAAADFGVTLSHPSPERAPHASEDTTSMLARGGSGCGSTEPCACRPPARRTACSNAARRTSV